MPSPTAWNLIRAVPAGLTVLLLVVIWTGEVHAGCGDHVVILPKKHDGHKSLPVPVQCGGANCSLKQAPPIPSPAAPVHAKQSPLDALLPIDSTANHAAGGPLLSDHATTPISRTTDVFRPPRCECPHPIFVRHAFRRPTAVDR